MALRRRQCHHRRRHRLQRGRPALPPLLQAGVGSRHLSGCSQAADRQVADARRQCGTDQRGGGRCRRVQGHRPQVMDYHVRLLRQRSLSVLPFGRPENLPVCAEHRDEGQVHPTSWHHHPYHPHREGTSAEGFPQL